MSGCLLQGRAFILKNVRKEIYRLPSSSLFGCVCCGWKSLWPTWLWLSLPSLCSSVEQPSVQINRKGRAFSAATEKGAKLDSGELGSCSHDCVPCGLFFPLPRSGARTQSRGLCQRPPERSPGESVANGAAGPGVFGGIHLGFILTVPVRGGNSELLGTQLKAKSRNKAEECVRSG